MGKPTILFPNRPDTNRKRARSLKFRINKVEEELYYPSSENTGADQLRSNCEAYCEAYQRLCFRLCRLLVFPWGGSILLYPRYEVRFFLYKIYDGFPPYLKTTFCTVSRHYQNIWTIYTGTNKRIYVVMANISYLEIERKIILDDLYYNNFGF